MSVDSLAGGVVNSFSMFCGGGLSVILNVWVSEVCGFRLISSIWWLSVVRL